ncbi:MAG: B12-binding domain-containing radical SAM protein [Chlorobium phaeobacteroides]|uniref:Radical SAM domain protein n=1 Tax=Chlorobium phaeobacteroides (strain BS1) TaxID=331678 RepID=B3EMA0_CHLPB|nr:B12-binding domain-containing radical SAM protein [Chlorobium phaeobacteroides]
MAYFNHVSLVEAPQSACVPFPQYISDIIGICYLAAAVKNDVETLSIPENYYNAGIFTSFERLLKKQPAEIVGISSMTGAFSNAVRLAEIARKHGAFVVMGGFHPTALPEEVLKLSCIDAVVIGEGEETFRDLVLHGPGREVKGLVFRENGGIVYSAPREIIRDIDALSFPLRSLRPDRYEEKGTDYSIDTIHTSRGCPWVCSFCANDQVHKQWRGRSAESVVDEFAELHSTVIKKRIKIWDANFLTSIGRVERICDMMIERGLTNFRITTETRAKDLIRGERILEKLSKIGLNKVGLGIESPNAGTLQLLNKKNDLDLVSTAVALAGRHGIGTEGYFIIGHNHESEEDTMAYPEFAKTLGLPQSVFMVMTPYPGTKVFEEYRRENRVKSFDWDRFNNFIPVIETERMGSSDISSMMVYCDIAFATLDSMLRRNRERDVLLVLLKDIFRNVLILGGNKVLDADEISEIVFNAFLRFAGKAGGVVVEKTLPPSVAPLREPCVVTLRASDGKSIDITLRQREDRREVTMFAMSGRKTTGRHPVIDLDILIRFVSSLKGDMLMEILYRFELLRYNPGKRYAVFFSLLRKPEMVFQAGKMAALFARSL